MAELEQILRKATQTEEVIAISDLTVLGGCILDFSPDGDETVEMLLTCWGKHESMAKDVAGQLADSTLFRGN